MGIEEIYINHSCKWPDCVISKSRIMALVCKPQDLVTLGFAMLLWCQSDESSAVTVTLARDAFYLRL